MADTQTVTDENGNIHTFPAKATPKMIAAALGIEVDDGSVDYDPMVSLQNLPESGAKYVGDLATGIASMSPIGIEEGLRKPPIIDNLAQIISGAAQHSTGLADEAKELGVPTPSADVAGAVGEHYSDRYGDWDKIKATAMQDPVGLLSDVSLPISLLGGGIAKTGQMASNVDKLSKVGQRTQQLGNALKTAGEGADLAGLAGKGAKHMIYKPSVTHGVAANKTTDDISRAANKTYDAGIAMSERGLGKLDDLTDSKMLQRDEILQDIPVEFSVTNRVRPTTEFVDDLLDPDSALRGRSTVPEAQTKMASETQNAVADALRGGQRRDALGLNRIKSRNMRVANELKAYEPSANQTVEALTRRSMGTKLKETLERAAGRKGDKLRGLNEDYGDLAGVREALADALGKSPKFQIDYAVRSGATAMGVPSKAAVGIAALLAGGAKVGSQIGLLLRSDTKLRMAVKTALIQEGRTEKEAEKIIRENQ